jgi:hypothetical protein
VSSGKAMEKCANCGATIGNLETPFVWKEATICAACYAKLARPHVVDPAETFDSLEELAKATQRQSQHAPHADPCVATKQPAKKLSIALWIGAGVIWLLVLAFGCWYLRELGQQGLAHIVGHDSTRNPLEALTGSSRSEGLRSESNDPQFSISRREYDSEGFRTGVGWEIMNASESALTISRVSINGEFDAPIAEAGGRVWIRDDKSKSLPVSLTIGDSVLFLQWTIAFNDAPSYTKEAIFIDIDTNRGSFRYREGGGFERR